MSAELGASRLIRTEIELQVERYAALDPEILAALTGDHFPNWPLRIVASGHR
jgi:hypothetical protein